MYVCVANRSLCPAGEDDTRGQGSDGQQSLTRGHTMFVMYVGDGHTMSVMYVGEGHTMSVMYVSDGHTMSVM